MRKKPGPAKQPAHLKTKNVLFSLSQLAYKKLLQIPSRERSRRVSKFLERCKPGLILRDPGERLVPTPEPDVQAQIQEIGPAEQDYLDSIKENQISERNENE